MNFKISEYGINQPQALELCYNEWKESEKFPWTFSIKVKHEWEEKYWNYSSQIWNTLKLIWAKKGTTIYATRKAWEWWKSFTEITLTPNLTEWKAYWVSNEDNQKTKQELNKIFEKSEYKINSDDTQAKREFSIIVQSLLHIPWYYKDMSFAQNLEKAIIDAKLFLKEIAKVDVKAIWEEVKNIKNK